MDIEIVMNDRSYHYCKVGVVMYSKGIMEFNGRPCRMGENNKIVILSDTFQPFKTRRLDMEPSTKLYTVVLADITELCII